MSDATPIPALDLERATFDTPATAERMRCAFCDRELQSSYFDVNGRPACEGCRYGLEQEQHRGAGVRGFVKALAAGIGAAIAGFLLYWLIEELTGLQLGLIAIVVGVMVGRAVRWGSGHRGGWVYQTMAVALTYLAITCSYLPMIFKHLREEGGKRPSASAGPTAGEATADGATTATKDAEATGGAAEPSESRAPMSVGQFVVGIGSLVLFAAALPFLAGAKNILGILILGFGVWEAWKVNRRPKITITGPLRLGNSAGSTGARP